MAKEQTFELVNYMVEDRIAWITLNNAERMNALSTGCLLYTSPSPRDGLLSRMPSSA